MDSSITSYLLGSEKIHASNISAWEWRYILEIIVGRSHTRLKCLSASPLEGSFASFVVSSVKLGVPVIYEDDVSRKTLCLPLGIVDDFEEAPEAGNVGCRQVLFLSPKGEFILCATNYKYAPANERTTVHTWRAIASRAWKAREMDLISWLDKKDGFSVLQSLKSIVDGNVKDRLDRLSTMQEFSWELDNLVRRIKVEVRDDF